MNHRRLIRKRRQETRNPTVSVHITAEEIQQTYDLTTSGGPIRRSLAPDGSLFIFDDPIGYVPQNYQQDEIFAWAPNVSETLRISGNSMSTGNIHWDSTTASFTMSGSVTITRQATWSSIITGILNV